MPAIRLYSLRATSSQPWIGPHTGTFPASSTADRYDAIASPMTSRIARRSPGWTPRIGRTLVRLSTAGASSRRRASRRRRARDGLLADQVGEVVVLRDADDRLAVDPQGRRPVDAR